MKKGTLCQVLHLASWTDTFSLFPQPTGEESLTNIAIFKELETQRVAISSAET